jgi:hypothetical protein
MLAIKPQDLSDAEESDDRDEEVETAHQFRLPEGQTQLPGHRVHADGGQCEAERHRRQDLERGSLAHSDEAAKGQQVDGKVFRRAESQCEPGHQRCQEGDHHHRHQGTHERGNWIISREYDAAMLAQALCTLEGFTYAPSEVHWWQHGSSSERDYIYVTTQNLSADQLQALAEEVGPQRSLVVVCSAWRGVTAAVAAERWPNLTLKKSEDGAVPLRMGARRLQPQCCEPADGATIARNAFIGRREEPARAHRGERGAGRPLRQR